MSEIDELAQAAQAATRRDSASRGFASRRLADQQRAGQMAAVWVALAVGGAIVGLATWIFVQRVGLPGGGGGAPAAAVAPVSANAATMVADYSANEIAADAAYRGRVVEVSGVVSAVRRDLGDEPFVTLRGGPGNFREVQCWFDRSAERDLAELWPGERVRIVGRCTGLMVNVRVEGCRLR